MSDPIHPELANGWYLPSSTPNFLSRRYLPFLLGRLGTWTKPPAGISQTDDMVPRPGQPSTDDSVPIVIVRPDTAIPGPARLPGILWIHGGGMVMGNNKMDLLRLYDWATPASDAQDNHLPQGAVIVSPEYRLAPEYPAPAPCDDCYATWLWMVEHADDLGIDTSRLVIAGSSAGGGLAAITAQRILDEHRANPDQALPLPVVQILVYPMLDDRTVVRCDEEAQANGPGPKHIAWNSEWNRYGWTSYLGGLEPGASAASLPAHSVPARREDLSGLPRTWIGVGSNDLFADEDKEYARRLEQAGVEVDLKVVKGAYHAFDALFRNAEVVRDFKADQMRVMREALR